MYTSILYSHNDAYTIGYNVVHNGKQWKENKRKEVFVTPELKKNKWVGNVDKMYIGAHLVNEFQGTAKISQCCF